MPDPATRDRLRTITPYPMVAGLASVIRFLETAFDATTHACVRRDDGTVAHAELQIGDSILMMGAPSDRFGALPGSIYLHLPDCDERYEKAIAAGGESIMPMTDKPHAGERYGGVRDPAGNIWWIGTTIDRR